MSAVAKLAKPQLRGMCKANAKKSFALGAIAGATAFCSYWFGVYQPRKARYRDFYATYDWEKDYQKMVEAGVFQSVLPSGEINSEAW